MALKSSAFQLLSVLFIESLFWGIVVHAANATNKEASRTNSCPHETAQFDGLRWHDGNTERCYVFLTLDMARFHVESFDEAEKTCEEKFIDGHLADLSADTLPRAELWDKSKMYWILNDMKVLKVLPRPSKQEQTEKGIVRKWILETSYSGGKTEQSRVQMTHDGGFLLRWEARPEFDYASMLLFLARSPNQSFCSYIRKSNEDPPTYGTQTFASCSGKTLKWNTYICETRPYAHCKFILDEHPVCAFSAIRHACFKFYRHVITSPEEGPYGECRIEPGFNYSQPCACESRDRCSMTEWQEWSSFHKECGNATHVRYKPPNDFPLQSCDVEPDQCCSEQESQWQHRCACELRKIECQHGGTCYDASLTKWRCTCPWGFTGSLCQFREVSGLMVGISTLWPIALLLVLLVAWLGFSVMRRKAIWQVTQRRLKMKNLSRLTEKRFLESLAGSVRATFSRKKQADVPTKPGK